MTKQTLRAEVIARAKNLSSTYCREADEAICRRVIGTDIYEKARTIFCYVGTEREIDTMRLIHIMMRDGKKVAVPLCVEKGVMEARRIEGMGDLVSGRYGILAPRLQCPVVAPEDLDLVIVPCCTGNAKGERLGYGGGYYDRYLPKVKCPTMLLCRHQLEREDIPLEAHDVRMDYFVTERDVAACRAEGE
ncbi:MAG: 5-formyltetrahydrofolate cyclo-ligase [Oscillospiraceae bacterium]|nr:5-formyltetrahydrofolate cyclo-ligase [Oscillospiraceae bacterium]